MTIVESGMSRPDNDTISCGTYLNLELLARLSGTSCKHFVYTHDAIRGGSLVFIGVYFFKLSFLTKLE